MKRSILFSLLCFQIRNLNVIKAYDVWKEKKNYGKVSSGHFAGTYSSAERESAPYKVSMGVVRTTYLIDENGVIVKAMDKVKAADNPQEMLELL